MNDVFRALSDPTRREIVQLLRSGSRTAGEIAEAFPLAKSTLSAHFNVLKQAGLIVGERHGATIVYRLNSSVLHDLVGVVLGWLGDRAPATAPAPAARRAGTRRPAPSTVPAHPSAVPPPPAAAATRLDVLRGGLLLLTGGLAGRAATAAETVEARPIAPDVAPGTAGPATLRRRFDLAAAARKFAH